MIDPDEHESKALGYASEMAGEYLESLSITDLSQMTGDQWRCMIECAVTGYGDKLREILSDDQSERR